MTKFALVGDVGGTNARLALCDLASGEISRAKTYSGLDYPSLEAVVRVYLEEHQVTLMKDIAMFDQMYELNTKYYKELTMYIIAGKKRLELHHLHLHLLCSRPAHVAAEAAP